VGFGLGWRVVVGEGGGEGSWVGGREVVVGIKG
jgi:hypothetical protein